MPQIVDIEGVGVIQFPDDASEDEILRTLRVNFPSPERSDLMKQMAEVRAEPQMTTGQAMLLREGEGEANRQVAEAIGGELSNLVGGALGFEVEAGEKQPSPMALLNPSWGVAAGEIKPQFPEGIMQPSVTLPKLAIPEDAGFVEAFSRSIANAGISLPEFFTSPAGVATAAGGAVAKLGTTAFWTTKLAKDALSEAAQSYENWDQMSPADKGQAVAGIVGSALMAGLGGKALAGELGEGATGATIRAKLTRPLPSRAQRASLSGLQTPLPPAMAPLPGAAPKPTQPPVGGVVSPIFASQPATTIPTQPAPPVPIPVVPAPIVDASGLAKAQADAVRVGLVESAKVSAESPLQVIEETPAQRQPGAAVTTAGQVEPVAVAPTTAAGPPSRTPTTEGEVSQAPVEKYVPDWRTETGWNARPISVDEARKLLREEGIKPDDVDALLEGKMSINEVIDKNLEEFNPPRITERTPTDVGGEGHAEAVMAAWDQAYRRLSYVLDNLEKPGVPNAIPVREAETLPLAPSPPPSAEVGAQVRQPATPAETQAKVQQTTEKSLETLDPWEVAYEASPLRKQLEAKITELRDEWGKHVSESAERLDIVGSMSQLTEQLSDLRREYRSRQRPRVRDLEPEYAEKAASNEVYDYVVLKTKYGTYAIGRIDKGLWNVGESPRVETTLVSPEFESITPSIAFAKRLAEVERKVEPNPPSPAAPGPPKTTSEAVPAFTQSPEVAAGAQSPIAKPPASTTLPPASGQPQPVPQPATLQPAPPTAAPAGPQPFTPASLLAPKAKRVGIVPGMPLPQPSTVWNRLSTQLKKYWTSAGLSPESLTALKNAMFWNRNKYEGQMERINRDLRRAVRKAYGISAIGELMGGLRNIPKPEVKLMDEYLKGNVGRAAAIPVEIRGVLDNMRAVVDGLSTELANMLRAKAASLPPGSAAQSRALIDLSDSILANRNHYLNRSYKYFDSKLNENDWYSKMPEHVRLAAERYIQTNTGTGAPLTQLEAQKVLMNWLADLKPTGGKPGGFPAKLGAKDLSILMERKAIPSELRALLGEYEDPITNWTKTVSKLAQHVSAQKFLNDAKAIGLREGWLYEDKQAPPGFNRQIAGPGSDVMNPLSGMRTSPEIAEIFTEYSKGANALDPVWKTYLKANALTKVAATSWSLMTQQRNFGGQPYFWGMSGHWTISGLSTALKAMRAQIGGRGNFTSRQYLDEAAKYGIRGDTARAREIISVIEDADFQTVGPENLAEWSLSRLIKRLGFKKLPEIYQISDEFGKIVGWEAEKANLRKINPSWTEEQVKTEAANRIRNWYPTASMVPKAIRELRKLPLGPFMTFAYEAFRTSTNAIIHSIGELRSSNPVERSIGAKRLASQLLTLSVPTGISALTAYLYGVSGDEQDDFRLFQPKWSKDSQFAWLPSKPGERNTINLSYLNPYQYTDILQAIASGVRNDKKLPEIIANAAKEFFAPYLSETMLLTAFVDWKRNKTQAGGKIYNEEEDWLVRARKVANHFLLTFAPGTLKRAITRTLPAFQNAQPKYGRKLDPVREVAREVTGISMDGMDYKTGLAWAARTYKEGSDTSENIFRDAVRSPKPATDADMLGAFVDADRARQRNWTDLRLRYLAALRRGVSMPDAVLALKDNGVTGREAESIISGVYIPYNITPELYERALSVRKRIPMRDIGEYRKSVTRQIGK